MKKIYILMIAVLLGGIARGQWQQCNGPYAGEITIQIAHSNEFQKNLVELDSVLLSQ